MVYILRLTTQELIKAPTSLDVHDAANDHKNVFLPSTDHRLNLTTQIYSLFVGFTIL